MRSKSFSHFVAVGVHWLASFPLTLCRIALFICLQMLFAPGLTCFGCNWSIALWALGAVLLDDFNWTSGTVLVHQNGIGGSIGRLGGGGRYMGDPTETETDDARYSRHAHSHYSVDPAHSDKKILCGHRLVDHMRYICQGPSVGELITATVNYCEHN